ncbi:MAG TPA: polysaccharide deacetylase family protein [Candidatus Acidoferrum sp.]|nr:polysaccharide deacetylase family protein [Candidatus Acidoferrum sp.]
MNPWWIAAPTIVTGMAGMTAYAAVNSRAQLFGPALSSTNSARKLALTFDDGPNPSITPKLLNLLGRYQAKAAFFVVGKFARNCPELLKETYERGHEIGNHTESHPNLFFCGPQETAIELRRCSETIESTILEHPRFFRPPFGYRSPWLSEIVHSQNMQMVMWSLLPGDWRAKSVVSLRERMQRIATHAEAPYAKRKGHRSTAGEILCLHDGNYLQQNADRTVTLAALEYWLPRWRDLGLEFVTMSEAEKHSA